jgi:hypothetical protein
VYRGGREVCQNNAAGDALYKHRTQLMMVRQGWICCICKDPSRPISVASGVTFEHTDLRGMGGGRRDDRIELPDGTWINGAAHGFCNAEKGSKRQ